MRSHARTVSEPPRLGAGDDFQTATKARKCAEIEAKTVSRNREIETSRPAIAETGVPAPVLGRPSVSREPPRDAREAVDRFLLDWFEEEPGCELAFSEIHAFYMRQALLMKWPPVSQVLLSRRLRALGARREQRRVSEHEKPIFYVFPEGGEVECDPVRRAA